MCILFQKCTTPVTAFPDNTLCMRFASKKWRRMSRLPCGGASVRRSSLGLPYGIYFQSCSGIGGTSLKSGSLVQKCIL